MTWLEVFVIVVAIWVVVTTIARAIGGKRSAASSPS